MDNTWKAAERAVARLLGGRRLPLSGGGGGGRPDVDAGWCACEVKTRRKLPRWLLLALGQVRRAARDGQLPIVVLHELGRRRTEDLVVLTLGDFIAWFGRPEVTEVTDVDVDADGA